jgi:hypothetical protein
MLTPEINNFNRNIINIKKIITIRSIIKPSKATIQIFKRMIKIETVN